MNWLDSLRSRLFGSPRFRFHSTRSKVRKNPWRRLRLEYLEDRLAPSVSMVADINNYTFGSNPYGLTDVNGTVFFLAYPTNTQPIELYKTDGTAAGTAQVTFGNLSTAGHLTSFKGKLFFDGSGLTANATALWSSDGTVAGTARFLAGGDQVLIGTNEAVVGTKLFFDSYYNGLWVSDGTSSGTHPVMPGSTSGPTSFYNFTNVNGKLFFESHDNSTGNYTLWTSNGTAAGTTLVAQLTPNFANNFTAVGSKLYFEMYDSTAGLYALWKSDGTAAGTGMVADIGTTAIQFSSLTGFNSNVYFQVYDPTDSPYTNYALWVSNGTTAGPFRYNGGTTVVPVFGPSQMIVFSSILYFTGYETTHLYSLWKTDGVSGNNNTAAVQANGSNPFNFAPSMLTIVSGTELYFIASTTSNNGDYLWKTDGTSAGTTIVQTSNFAQRIGPLTASGSKVFFPASDVDANGFSPHGQEVWSSDGTNAGTAMVADVNRQTYNSNPSNLVAFGNEIFFNATTYSPNGTFLWQSDGTAADTALVQTATGFVPTSEDNSIAAGNNFFFTAVGPNGGDLWTSGTALKSAVELFPSGPNPFNSNFDFSTHADTFANLNGTLYFGAYDAANSKYALWKSNGTAAGTILVSDLDPSNQLYHLTAAGTNLFWQQYDSAHSTYALWTYNGTTASLVSDINVDGLQNPTAIGNSIFFEAYDTTAAKYALWISNGATVTELATFSTQFNSLINFNGKLFFVANNEMWSSDGTVAGTAAFLNALGEVVPLSIPNFAVVGNELFYQDVEPNGANLLAKTDGTPAGTATVQASSTGSIAQNPISLANDNGILVFSAYDWHGQELWQSDGTANGTLLVADINPGSPSSSPDYLTVAGSQVFFSADDGFHGRELWSATLAPTVVTANLSGPSDGVTEQHRPFVLTASDSNSGNNSAGFSFAINWGDGTSQTVIGQSGVTTDHQYSTAGTFALSVTATNLADNVTSAAFTQSEMITQTEIQGGNLALGGVAGNDAFLITPGTTGTFTVKVNGTAIITNFKPATGQQIFLYGGNGMTTIAINDSGTTNDAFVLGTGYVTFKGTTFVPQAPATWAINGNNGADTFTISGAANASIVGGSGKNTFKFVTGGSLTGTLNGGSGILNTLDYSGYATSGVIVDLPLGSATAVNGGANGGISGIRNVTGSKNGGDILVGDANPNVLKALKGHNLLIGGSGGGDTLTSGGADILIAGTTNYDTNIAALQFILNEWKVSTPATYASTINTIETSATDPLNSSMVFDSGSSDLADTLIGKSVAQADWFFAHTSGGTNPNDTITGEGSGDTVTGI